MASPFTPKTLAFLRALKRNNDREWFRARKDDYERHVRGPMVEAVGRLAQDLPRFAPELLADPKKSLFRVYRDTRFSEDKSPLKTNAAAVFLPRGMPRHGGAGLYFEIEAGWTWMGGGLYMPPAPALHAVRARIASSHPTLHRIVTSKTFTEVLGELHGDQLTRVPAGYARDHPAADYLRRKQFLGFREFPAEFSYSDDFYPELLRTFKALTPLVRFVNEAIKEGTPRAIVLGP